EYVCALAEPHCDAGAYDPSQGPFCFYTHSERELKASNFNLLINVGGFEALAWVNESFGFIPENAVEACPSVDLFIGRSKDGLGKVSKELRALFVLVDGQEVWYKWYQVLVVKKGLGDVTITDVHYNLSAAMEQQE
ncbi:Natterin-3, partial [Acanthisitta chloris]